jgi:hypothetical protein
MSRKRSLVDRALSDPHPYGPLHILYDGSVHPAHPGEPWYIRLLRHVLTRDLNLGAKRTEALIRRLRPSTPAPDLARHLSAEQRLIFNIHWFTAEVNNGGIVQYLWNSSGDRLTELLSNLQDLGMTDLRSALVELCEEIFGGLPPAEIESRRVKMVEFVGTHPLNDDDDWERIESMRRPSKEEATSRIIARDELALVAAVRGWIAANRKAFEAS